MIDITAFDTTLFLAINHLPHSPVIDGFSRIVSGIGIGALLWTATATVIVFGKERKDHWFIFKFIVTFLVSYMISEWLMKIAIGRLRPSPLMGAVLYDAEVPLSYSFPSTHSTVAWACAILLAHKEPRGRWLFYCAALAVSLSRIYLGMHYPLDVVGGAVVGIGIGLLIQRWKQPRSLGIKAPAPKKKRKKRRR